MLEEKNIIGKFTAGFINIINANYKNNRYVDIRYYSATQDKNMLIN